MLNGYMWKYSKNEEKEMKALMGFEPFVQRKLNEMCMYFLLPATLPTSINSQNYTWLLNMLA